MKKKIYILDCGFGNIESVFNAISYLGHKPIVVLDLNKINTCNFHYRNNDIHDDNILITNIDNATKVFSNIFTDIVEYHKGIGYIETAEKNFTNFLKRNNLIKICEKTDNIDFRVLRDDKVWF